MHERSGWDHRRRAARLALALGLVLGVALVGGTPANGAIHPGDAVVRTVEVPLDAAVNGGLGKGSVMCPSGTRVISGGAGLHPAGEGLTAELSAKVMGSAPFASGKGWRAAASSFEVGTTLLLRITAVCLPKARLRGYSVGTRELGPASGMHLAGSKGCPKGKRLVTGGLWWAGPDGIYGAENTLRSTPTKDAKRWRAAGFTYGLEERMRIIVVCLPSARLGPLTVRTRDYVGVGPGPFGTGGGVSCPGRQRALAGGADWRLDGVSTTGSQISSTVRSSLRGWYAADNNAADGAVLRVLVTCVPR